MSDKKVFIERRSEEGDYAVRKPASKRASVVADTQAEAIELAKKMNPDATILVERVRHTSGGQPDKWRRP
jgi:hypothetical protein